MTEKKASENVTVVSDKVVADIQPGKSHPPPSTPNLPANLTSTSAVSEKSITQKVADGTQAELKTTVESAKDTVSNIVNAAVEKVQAAGKQSPPIQPPVC